VGSLASILPARIGAFRVIRRAGTLAAIGSSKSGAGDAASPV